MDDLIVQQNNALMVADANMSFSIFFAEDAKRQACTFVPETDEDAVCIYNARTQAVPLHTIDGKPFKITDISLQDGYIKDGDTGERVPCVFTVFFHRKTGDSYFSVSRGAYASAYDLITTKTLKPGIERTLVSKVEGTGAKQYRRIVVKK